MSVRRCDQASAPPKRLLEHVLQVGLRHRAGLSLAREYQLRIGTSNDGRVTVREGADPEDVKIVETLVEQLKKHKEQPGSASPIPLTSEDLSMLLRVFVRLESLEPFQDAIDHILLLLKIEDKLKVLVRLKSLEPFQDAIDRILLLLKI